MTRRGLLWTGVAAAVLVIVELMPVHESHGHHWWHVFPGFDLLYGFVGCVFLVLAAKELRRVVKRDEDYYESDDD